MTSLAAVLIGHHVLPIETVEQAMLRQTLFGGDLATNLLELGAIDESTLVSVLGRSLELPSVEPFALPVCTELLRGRIPHALPVQRGVFPIACTSSSLCLAVSERLSEATVNELKQQLGTHIEQRAALRIRIQQAIVRDFGVPVDSRTTHLLALLDGNPRTTTHPPSVPPAPAPPPSVPPAPAPPPSVPPAPAPPPSVPPPLSTRPVAVRARAAATMARAALPKAAVGGEAARRRRGPFTAAMAEAELAKTVSATDALTVWLDFVSQYFDSASLLSIQNRSLLLRHTRGARESHETSAWKPTPLEPRGAIGQACERQGWLLRSLEDTGADGAVARGLGLQGKQKVLLLPVSVRSRAVALIVGDDAERDVELSQVGDVLSFTALVELSLERLLVERKRHQHVEIVAKVPPPAVAEAAKPPLPPVVEETAKPPLPPVVESPPDSPPPVEPLVPEVVELGPAFIPEGPPTLRAVPDPPRLPSPLADPHSGETLRAPEVVEIAWAHGEPRLLTPAAAASGALASTRSPGGPIAARSMEPEVGTRPGMPEPLAAVASLPIQLDPSGPPPSIDYGDDCRLLVERLLGGDTSVIAALVEMGDRAAALLSYQLPGPISRPPHPARGDFKPSDAGPVLRALVAMGPVARPHVITRTSDPSATVRAWSTRLLGELPGRQSAISVARRLVQDRHPEVRRAAFAAGQMLGRDPDAAAALRGALLTTASDRGSVITQRLAAIDALSDLRDVRAIPELVTLLGDGNPGTAAAAQQALVVLTRQDFGFDATAWLSWWNTNQNRHRLEWLIDAINHDSPTIRQLAAEELTTISHLYVGDIDDADAQQRGRAQQKYRDWYRSLAEPSVRPPPP